MSLDQPVQLRMPFGNPAAPVRLQLSLAGMVVLVTTAEGRDDLAAQYLADAGVPTQMSDERGLTFPAVRLGRLASLPERVTVSCDDALGPLFRLIMCPSVDSTPATLQINALDQFELSWFDGVCGYDEVLLPAAAPLLLHADLPFVATAQAWERLKANSNIAPSAGTLRTNLDGFVEVTTNRPQLVESAPVRGLFRLDDRHFGVPLAYASDLAAVEGFTWDGPRPVLERAAADLPRLPIALSTHHQRDLRDLVDALAAYRAQAVWWDSGLGRRVFALAAIEALEAWPALVVTPPAGMWAWLRHCDLLGRSVALTHQRDDVHLVTYHDLAHRRDIVAPSAILLDEVFCSQATTSTARAGLRRLDALMDTYRLAVSSTWPSEDRKAIVETMSLLRPAEFSAGASLPHRYPGDPGRRLEEHVAVYLSHRSARARDNDPTPFKRSSVAVVHASEAQVKALSQLAARAGDKPPHVRLAEAMEIASAGPSTSLSPKIAAAVDRARREVAPGRRVALVTRHRRTATLLTASLRGLPKVKVRQVDAAAGTPEGDLVVVRFDTRLPDLRGFAVVIVVDYPWSLDEIDRAVGAAGDDDGAQLVVVVHATGTVDDRLALLAARRRELATVTDPCLPPSPEETAYLLAPRS